MAQISGLTEVNYYNTSLKDVLMVNTGANGANSGGIEKKIALESVRQKFNGRFSFVADSLYEGIVVPSGQGQFAPVYCFLKATGHLDGSYKLVYPFTVNIFAEIEESNGSHNCYGYVASLKFKGYKGSDWPTVSDVSNLCRVELEETSYLPVGFRFMMGKDGNNIYLGVNWGVSMHSNSGFYLNMLAVCNGISIEEQNTSYTSDNSFGWAEVYGETVGSSYQPVYWSSKGLLPCDLSHKSDTSLPSSPDQNTIYYIP